MPSPPNRSAAGLHPISRPSGALAMVANDQRESLRMMFQAHSRERVTDERVADFKSAVAEVLAGTASAMLFDRDFGLPALRLVQERQSACGRILAADRLIQEPGKPVSDTDLDADLDLGLVKANGVVALKLLLLWKGAASGARCKSIAARFMALCRANGLIGIVEAMVRPPETGVLESWDQEGAIFDAAETLADSSPDLYKGEVPFHGKAEPEVVREHCRRISDALPCPWVVLSQGVEPAIFPAAVRAACRGGASGFLAGRAIWADTIGPGDYRGRLRTTALQRLRQLIEIVDAEARPWSAVNRAG